MVDPEPLVALGFAAIDKVTETLRIDGSATTAACYYIASRPLSAAEFNRPARRPSGGSTRS